LKISAARAAHTNGAMIKIHTDQNAHVWNNAGQKLLAGFTEVQVNHNHNKWTNVNDAQITIPATEEFSCLDVAQRTANTNTNVRIISANNPSQGFQ